MRSVFVQYFWLGRTSNQSINTESDDNGIKSRVPVSLCPGQRGAWNERQDLLYVPYAVRRQPRVARIRTRYLCSRTYHHDKTHHHTPPTPTHMIPGGGRQQSRQQSPWIPSTCALCGGMRNETPIFKPGPYSPNSHQIWQCGTVCCADSILLDTRETIAQSCGVVPLARTGSKIHRRRTRRLLALLRTSPSDRRDLAHVLRVGYRLHLRGMLFHQRSNSARRTLNTTRHRVEILRRPAEKNKTKCRIPTSIQTFVKLISTHVVHRACLLGQDGSIHPLISGFVQFLLTLGEHGQDEKNNKVGMDGYVKIQSLSKRRQGGIKERWYCGEVVNT